MALARFGPLSRRAEELLRADGSAKQAVAVLTAKGNVRAFSASGEPADEAAFIQTLSESGDTQILRAICMWSDGTPDVPSRYLRELLKALDPANLEAEFLLQGADGFNVKPLKVMFPSKKQPAGQDNDITV